MAIGLEHMRGPNGEQWTGMSPPQQRSQSPQQPKSPQPGVQTSMGNFPNLQAYQQQQDAFVQQHLKNQSQYNQGLQSGQSPQRVPVMEAWRQAGENIKSGQYQGNPFQTGNVDALMGMFGQYGIQVPTGFRDQLLANLGQQSAPPMYQPQPGRMYYHSDGPQMGYPGGPMSDPNVIPKFTNPATGLPYGQPVTSGPVGPNGEYWPAFPSPQPSPDRMIPALGPHESRLGEPMLPMAPGYGGRIGLPPGSTVTMDFRDRDGDRIDDRNQRGPGQPPTAAYGQPPQDPPSYDPTAPSTWGRDGGPPGWREAVRDRDRALAAMGPTPVMASNTPAQLLYADAQRRIGELENTYRDEGIPASSPVYFGEGGGGGGGGRAQPTPPRTQGTPYGTRRKKEDEPLDAAPGSSGAGWRESGGKRIYDGYTDPRGTGAVGAVGPNHIRPGMMRDPVTGRPVFDPFTDPIGTGGAPAYARNVPAGNTWGPGTSARREPAYRPSQPGPQRRRSGGDVFGVG